jgi:long-chain fatty acid transport protein
LLGNLDLQYSGAQPIVAGSGQYSVAQYNMLGMSGTRFNGFRAGLQYAPKDSRWGVGAEFRSAVNFTLTNNAVSASVLVPAAGITSPASLTGGQGAVTNSAPMNVSIGAHFDIIPATWRVMGEYTFTQYHDNVSLGVSASVVNPLTGTTVFPDIYQGWNNMHNLRFGTEYKLASDLALRAGYVWTSQVVPNSYANPLFEAPSFGNTVAIGAGKQILANLTLDGALEYSWANGTVATTDLPAATTLTGNYVTSAYAFHLGASLAF